MGLPVSKLLSRSNGYCVPFKYLIRQDFEDLVHWIKERGSTFSMDCSQRPFVLIFPDALTAVACYLEFSDRLHHV